jgi:6-pyruvoyltetrahydropterin/6-carboxytetrahydropterin synthase
MIPYSVVAPEYGDRMYFISKQFHFSASHEQSQLPPEYACSRLHGHNYIVEINMCAPEVDDWGFAFDIAKLKPFQRIIDDELDHRHLNDILPGQTSTECLAKWLYDRAKALYPDRLYSIRVSETPKIWAEYRESV